MTNDSKAPNGHGPSTETNGESSNFTVKAGLAQMMKGGVIMDVVNAEQVPNPHRLVPTLNHDYLTHTLNLSGQNSRRGRGLRRNGPGACPCRHPSPGGRGSYVGPEADQGDHGRGDHTRHGEGADRALRRMPGTLPIPLSP